MSTTRRLKRAQQRKMEAHFSFFSNLLMDFYEFLESTPKPNDEEVRARFINDENRWKAYCSKKQLSEEASLLFNKEVSQSWKNRYKQKPESELTTK